VAGAAVMLYVKFATTIPFTWWVVIGCATTFSVGYAASFITPDSKTGLDRNEV